MANINYRLNDKQQAWYDQLAEETGLKKIDLIQIGLSLVAALVDLPACPPSAPVGPRAEHGSLPDNSLAIQAHMALKSISYRYNDEHIVEMIQLMQKIVSGK